MLTIDGQRFRFPENSVSEVRNLVAPHLLKLGTGLINPEDLLPIGPMPDVSFEDRPGGVDVCYSDRLAHDHESLVEESAEWLRQQPGVRRVVHEDRELLLVDGHVDQDLRDALKAWWTQRLENFDPN
jgi:hypothetical protein